MQWRQGKNQGQLREQFLRHEFSLSVKTEVVIRNTQNISPAHQVRGHWLFNSQKYSVSIHLRSAWPSSDRILYLFTLPDIISFFFIKKRNIKNMISEYLSQENTVYCNNFYIENTVVSKMYILKIGFSLKHIINPRLNSCH